jgi:hypothetical protein
MGVFTLYVLAITPTPYLLDSAELGAASFGLGIAHPPGEALALLWGKAFALLPLGSVAFRVGLGQAVAGAAAAALVYGLGRALLDALDPRGVLSPAARALLAAAAALGFALAPGTVMVSNRPEVYALQTALSLGAIGLALRAAASRDPRPALLAAFSIGLGVANHPLIAGLAGLGAVAAAAPLLAGKDRPSRLRLIALAVAALVAGALVLVYLPVRAAALFANADGDAIGWGDGRTAAGLWWILSARTFIEKASIVHTAATPEAAPFAIMAEVGPALALLALAGGFFVLRRKAARAAGIALLAGGGGALGAALGAGFDPTNPDIHGYMGVAYAVVALLGALGLGGLLAGLGRSAITPVPAAALLAVVVGTAWWSLGERPDALGLARSASADRVSHELLAALPPRGLLLTSHFETGFLVAYQRLVEGRRPDAAWVHLGFAAAPGYGERVTAAHAELAPLWSALAAGPLVPAALDGLPRPAALEADLRLGPIMRARLVPDGPLWRLAPEDPAPTPRLMLEDLDEAARDRQVRGFLGLRAYLDATLACEQHFSDLAITRLQELDALVPDDQRAAALASRCRGDAGN